eukprot:symbB.v1.2.007819.t1/scaffold487.1/size197638/9
MFKWLKPPTLDTDVPKRPCHQMWAPKSELAPGRTGDQIDMNTMYQAWMCWTSLTRTDRLDKYYSGKIESKRKQLSSVQVLFQSFADELESGLGIKEQEDDSGGASKAANGRGIAKNDAVYAMAGAVSLPDIHAKKGSQ